MIVAPSTVVAYSLAAYLATTDIAGATSIANLRDMRNVEASNRQQIGRSSWAGSSGYQSPTVNAEPPVLILADRPEDGLIALVVDFLDLAADWDGEGAAAPGVGAVVDAVRFINAAGSRAVQLEPTLHVDGSVILEVEDGSAGSLRFRGDGTIVYAIEGVTPGIATFDGYTIPEAIGAALRS